MAWGFGTRASTATVLCMHLCIFGCSRVNSLRPRQNGWHFPDDIFKWIFVNGNIWILINISLKFVRKGLINNIPALVLIMAWRRPGDKPLSEPMLVISLTHKCLTRPQWVNAMIILWASTFAMYLWNSVGLTVMSREHGISYHQQHSNLFINLLRLTTKPI